MDSIWGDTGRRSPAALAALALCLFCFGAWASSAAAADFTVNTFLDGSDVAPGDGVCATSRATCSLRAAIEESNRATAAQNSIDFASGFDGQFEDLIFTSAALPTITQSVSIEAVQGPGGCITDIGPRGPCAGLLVANGATGLVVEAPLVKIAGLAIGGGAVGIRVGPNGDAFEAVGNWIGPALSGTSFGNQTGIVVGTGADEAVIGGTSPDLRNVISGNAGTGVAIVGATLTRVKGNYFGVSPIGDKAFANGTDISVGDGAEGAPSIGTEIGLPDEGSAQSLATPECDGGCNVISGASGAGIDLAGLGDQTSRTTRIRGNLIGLDSSGTTVIPNGSAGIQAGSSRETTIGGALPEDANRINGGTVGISAGSDPSGLKVEGNLIGLNPAGTSSLAPPTQFGIGVDASRTAPDSKPPLFARNRIATAGEGILQRGSGARIEGNAIASSTVGIHLVGADPTPSTVVGNSIAGASRFGLLIENSGNTIGGDATGDNTISGSAAAAIAIVGADANANQVLSNHGAGNGGPFVDLGGDGPGPLVLPGVEPNPLAPGPNHGILAPRILTVLPSGLTGQADPGALVSLYAKASNSPGELASLLGTTTADGGGAWTFPYAAPPAPGTFVAASQSDLARGSSELTLAVPDTTPPQTTITKGPKKPKPKPKPKKGKGKKAHRPAAYARASTGHKGKKHKPKPHGTAKFLFVADEVGSSFQCKLDGKPFAPCSSPRSLTKLKPGKHVFQVRAIDTSGNVDPTPAVGKFTIPR